MLVLPVIMIDGFRFTDRATLIELGVDELADKHILGICESSSEVASMITQTFGAAAIVKSTTAVTSWITYPSPCTPASTTRHYAYSASAADLARPQLQHLAIHQRLDHHCQKNWLRASRPLSRK